MIINVRGPCASGKSTLVRKVMASYPSRARIVDGRAVKGYVLVRPDERPLFVLGNYEREHDGGTDSIKRLPDVYYLARHYSLASHVLFEGHADNDATKHVLELANDRQVYVIFLDTSVEECERQFRARYNKGRHREHLRAPSDVTIQRAVYGAHAKMKKHQVRLESALGPSRSRWMSRDAALKFVVSILRGPA